MAKKDKKGKSAEQKARKAAKQSKKAAKGEKKDQSRAARDDDSDAEEVDLDAVLAAYAEEQAKFLKVTEATSRPPSPRSSATIIASPSNRNELFVFGGESFDGTVASFYNNLYVYLIDRNEWREITSPNTPLPRSGHAWCRGGNSGGIYLFGGEFSSPKQGTFYHYNDFWHLDPSTREWSRIETKGKGPPARSGHRMTYFKQYILLFGGFQDTSQQTKYLQDLWIYDTQNFVWYSPTLPPASQKPDARSSFSFLPHDAGAVLYGGYSRVKANANKQGKAISKTTLQPVVHQDTWFLRTTPPEHSGPTAPTVRWDRRKKPANPPNPPRAGATMTYHKGRGIMFGGVHDIEESEEGIDSEFFDGLFAWNIERNRFFPLTLRRPRAPGKKQPPAGQSVRGRNRGKADEEELLRNLAALDTKGRIDADIDAITIDNAKVDEEDDDDKKIVLPVRFEMPHRRFNAQITVQDDVLFIFGGTVERGDQEFTFDDMYSIDLGKLDGVREIYYNEPERWNDKMDIDSDEDEDEEYDDDDDESDVSEIFDQESTISSPPRTELNSPDPFARSILEEPTAQQEEPVTTSEKDGRPYPRPFESLRDFFSRTSTDWQNLVLDALKYAPRDQQDQQSVKEIRKRAFDMAEDRWWACREEIRALEDEQEEAGIGEVVSLADKGVGAGGGGAGGAAGRRR